MMDLSVLGRLLVFLGLVIIAMGGLMLLWGRGFPPGLSWLGRLPGDVYIQQKNFTFYFPLATSLLLSLIFSLIIYFFIRR